MNRLPFLAWTLLLALVPAIAKPPATATVSSQPPESPFPQQSIVQIPEISDAVVTLFGVGGKGTGTIVFPEGVVLTSEHVVRSARRGQVSVRLADGSSHPGRTIAVEPETDLALVQILANRRFATLPLNTSDDARVGQPVYALDRPFESLSALTSGTLRHIADDGQLFTDIVFSPGDSGGPLLDARGRVIGVNKAIVHFQDGSDRTWGLAVNIAIVRDFVARARANPDGPLAPTPPPFSGLGVTVEAGTTIVASIEPGSLADRWGLQPGDRLVAANNKLLESLEELNDFLRSRPPEAILTIERGDRFARLRIRL